MLGLRIVIREVETSTEIYVTSLIKRCNIVNRRLSKHRYDMPRLARAFKIYPLLCIYIYIGEHELSSLGSKRELGALRTKYIYATNWPS